MVTGEPSTARHPSATRLPWWVQPAAGLGLFTVGMAAWMLAGFCALGGIRPPQDWELPLGSPVGVALDSQGRIYVASQAYSRIQVYDRDGAFLWGWQADTRGGIFRIVMDPQDRLDVSAARRDAVLIYSSKGELLHTDPGSPFLYLRLSKLQAAGRDSLGNSYEIRNPILLPRVVRVAPSGQSKTVIRTRVLLWPLTAPFPVLVLMAAGAALTATSKRFWDLVRRLPMPGR